MLIESLMQKKTKKFDKSNFYLFKIFMRNFSTGLKVSFYNVFLDIYVPAAQRCKTASQPYILMLPMMKIFEPNEVGEPLVQNKAGSYQLF